MGCKSRDLPRYFCTSQIGPHLDYETGVLIFLVEAACRWFGQVALFRSLKIEVPKTTSSNHLKRKNSSMELTVIWGNSDFAHTDFPHSDFAHSDFPHSDFAHCDFPHSDFTHSDFAHSDFAHSDFAHSDFAHFFVKYSNFFHSIFTTWELIWYTCKWNIFNQMELLHIVSQQYPYNTKIIAWHPFLNFLSKNWLFNPNFRPT